MYRIAAVEQLKTYAELLNAPLEVCYTQEEFKAAQQKFADFDHVFIDTAGRNFKDGQYVKELKDIIPFDRGLQAFLVLSATSKYSDMKELVRRFADSCRSKENDIFRTDRHLLPRVFRKKLCQSIGHTEKRLFFRPFFPFLEG